ncbi:hypothetical protein BD413DRAFT_496239 [Trametes elegans]|nr:hypothetical protein BD413DRAFT_496239 [Trametes elegans]
MAATPAISRALAAHVPPSATVLKLRALVQKARVGPAPKLGLIRAHRWISDARSVVQEYWADPERELDVHQGGRAGRRSGRPRAVVPPYVNHSILFGRGKFQYGILMELMDEEAIDPTDPKQVEVFRNNIWPSIERANEFAPQHSRSALVILVASPSKPFRLNFKGLPRRGVILTNSPDEIKPLAQSDLQSPAVWDAPNTLTFIRAVVEHTLRRSVSDDADIFRSGGDNLQATWIRNTILRASRDSDPGAVKRLPMNLVFKAPTISALTNIVHAVMNDVHAVANVSHTPHDLWKYVEEYSANFPFQPADLVDCPSSAKEVVLITGTTGGFGCDALEYFLRDDSIKRVYAFNRKGSDALARQQASWPRNSGWSKPWSGFDLAPQLLEEIRGLLTHIVHNVDLQGPRKLVDLAISSPFTQAPTILFFSCKWVTKRVLQNAAKERGICSIVMRLGQVAGYKTGHWTRKSGSPRSSSQRCLRDLEANVAWVPGQISECL